MKKECSKFFKEQWIYLLCLITNFYILPFIARYFDSSNGVLFILLIIPAICFACGIVKGVQAGINLPFLLSVPILFAPTVFLFYNSSALIYVLIYFGIAGVGNIFGSLFHKFNH